VKYYTTVHVNNFSSFASCQAKKIFMKKVIHISVGHKKSTTVRIKLIAVVRGSWYVVKQDVKMYECKREIKSRSSKKDGWTDGKVSQGVIAEVSVLVDESVNKVMKQTKVRGEWGMRQVYPKSKSRHEPESEWNKKQEKPINRQMKNKKKIESLDQARLLGLSRPATRLCKTRKWLGLLQLPPHGLGCNCASSPDGSDSSGKKSKSRPPVQEGCDKRPISPVIGSVIDVCVVTLLPVVPVVAMDVAVACGTSGCGCPSDSPIPL
jgi:hypothetical protein